MTQNGQYYRDTCYFCGHGDEAALEKHHIVPNRFGGSDEAENLVVVCANCHRKLEKLYGKRFYSELGIEANTNELEGGDIDGDSPKKQRERIKMVRGIIEKHAKGSESGAPVEVVLSEAIENGVKKQKVIDVVDKLRQRGEVYESPIDELQVT